ncbi:GMP/IMP nucleotidase [Agaribacter marinus]|uniref:Haloacid dehalogenase n=1 Tax=Agaribacter marinus TaxID=1431249 RepID=A0AA37SX97_9ALTE|nr:GMP/IMP nucleotidase [Agaribacter marinus]GLR71442.1 haloacid dehalogenase [Agaribacter marinus]
MTRLPWHNIETVLLDMDGTLLDLHFDNQFWLELIPQKLAIRSGKSIEICKQELEALYAKVHGQLEWYCLDYWAKTLDLDIVAAKQELKHLIEMRKDTIPFLVALRQSGRQVILVTNAHPESLRLKVEQTQLDQYVDMLISSHEFGVSKESQSFWQKLHNKLLFRPEHTLFVDDSERILDAASEYGIKYTLGITNPDSKKDENVMSRHLHINDYALIADSIISDNFVGASK